MPRPISQSPLMRPFVALALPGMFLVYRYNQYRRQQQEASKRKAAEKELVQLNHKIDKLLSKLDEHEPELARSQEEECVICVNAKATMQTFPCGHRVVCRKCFVKTIQMAVSQRLLPLRCVVCRAKILRLRQSRDGPFPSSVSQYSMSACGNGIQHHVIPASHSLYSFTSGSSGFSGVSSVSSASSESGGSMRGNAMRTAKVYRQGGRPQIIKKVKVSSKSGARDKEPLKGELPLIRIDNYDVIPVRFTPITRSPRAIIRENKVAPQDVTPNNRLPTIKECGEFISERDIEIIDKSSSTRIRCAQKLVNQLELNNNNSNNNNNNNLNNNNNNNNNYSNPNTNNNNYQPNLKVPLLKVLSPTPSPPRKATITSSKSSSSIKSSSKPLNKPATLTAHSKSLLTDKKFTNKFASYSGGGNVSNTKTGNAPVKSSSVSSKLTSGGKSSTTTKTSSTNNGSSSSKIKNDRRDSSSSSVSIRSSPSICSNISIISSRSSSSTRSGSSTQSSSSYKSATSNNSSTKSSTSSFSTSSTLTIKSCRSLIPSLRKDTPCQKGLKEDFDKIESSPKHEHCKTKSQKKRFEGREYHRLH